MLASILGFADQHPGSGRAGIRGASRDYMPIAGAVPDTALPEGCYGGALLSTPQGSAPDSTHENIARLPSLYISTGHGSHGSVSCPLIAEHIAAMICAELSPLPGPLSDLIDPVRFLRRQRRRQGPQR